LIVEVAEVQGYPLGGVSLLLVNGNLFLQIDLFVESKRKFSHVHAFAGGVIAVWKSVLITVKVEIGVAAAQIELRGVADRRRLDW
jgi:hypothetical protein